MIFQKLKTIIIAVYERLCGCDTKSTITVHWCEMQNIQLLEKITHIPEPEDNSLTWGLKLI